MPKKLNLAKAFFAEVLYGIADSVDFFLKVVSSVLLRSKSSFHNSYNIFISLQQCEPGNYGCLNEFLANNPYNILFRNALK